MQNPSEKILGIDANTGLTRNAYWDANTGTVVINNINPSAFKPGAGYDYWTKIVKPSIKVN